MSNLFSKHAKQAAVRLTSLFLVGAIVSACGAPINPQAPEVTRIVEVTRVISPAAANQLKPTPTNSPYSNNTIEGELEFGDIVERIKKRGKLLCGVTTIAPGFAWKNDKGVWQGHDVDICKALAVAMFGDPNKLEVKAAIGLNKLRELHNGDVDVLIRYSTWTVQHTADLSVEYVIVTYYDGQGVIANKSKGFKTLADLKGKPVCVPLFTTAEWNMTDKMEELGIEYNPVTYDSAKDAWAAYESGICEAYVNDKSTLAAQASAAAKPGDHRIMDLTISKESLGPVVQHGDDQWFDIVKWTYYALWAAEEYGITSKTVDRVWATSKDPETRRLLGLEGGVAEKLGVDRRWVYNMVKQVGNYQEIWDRNLGPDTPTPLPRGLHNIYINGGMQYAPPFRLN
ncbi:MAG: amino acid ABC transporter substrate-binding protein [Anaerolineae bacterium]|nr:amino acid ABC transporter substrate-binding protein [Anaerolineae bacterium]